MRRAALLALLALAAPVPARADPAEGCRTVAARLKEAGRTIDGTRDMTLAHARELAAEELQLSHGAEVRSGERKVLLPWIDGLQSNLAKDTETRDVAERLHFASERLSLSCDALEAPAAPAPPAPDRARLLAILSRPEYDLHSRDEQFLARLLQRVWTWFRDVFAQSEAVQRGALSLRAAFLIATCLVVAYVAFRLSRARTVRRHRAMAGRAGAIALDDPARYDADAGQALSRGDGREAIRLGLLSVLSTLERARLCAPGRAATNREVADHVARRGGASPLADAVRELVRWYDDAWYGLSAIGEAEARRFLESARTLCAQAAQARPKELA